MDEGEVPGVVRVDGDSGRVGSQASAGGLHMHAKVPPTGFILRAAHQPGIQSDVPDIAGRPKGVIHPSNIIRGRYTHAGTGARPTPCQ